MNQYAPVASLPIYKRLAAVSNEMFGAYHLLIATEVLKDPEAWGEFWDYRNLKIRIADQYEDVFVIMDNGLIETGKPLKWKELTRAATTVGASCIVLPDALGDFKTTKKRVIQAMKGITPGDFPLLGVIQGRTDDEVLECLELYQKVGVSYISIPRVMVDIFGSRKPLIRFVQHAWNGPIHLLGFSDNLNDDMESAAMPGVMGIDSAVPIWRGLLPICEYLPVDPPPHVSYGKRPKEYWTQTPSMVRGDFDIVAMNIEKVRWWIAARIAHSAQDQPVVPEGLRTPAS